jgi:hypothetical protein
LFIGLLSTDIARTACRATLFFQNKAGVLSFIKKGKKSYMLKIQNPSPETNPLRNQRRKNRLKSQKSDMMKRPPNRAVQQTRFRWWERLFGSYTRRL